MSLPGCSSLEHFQWLLMPCELKFKLSNMAHQLHTLQLVLHATWPMDLALPLCAAPPSGTSTALWTSHSSLRTSSISISVSLEGLFSSWWCPALSSQSLFRRPPSWPYHSKMQELDSLSATGPKCPVLFILAPPGSTSLPSALPGHCWGSVNFG